MATCHSCSASQKRCDRKADRCCPDCTHPGREDEIVMGIIDEEMLQFTAQFQSALGKMKAAHETDTNALLLNSEVEAVLVYLKAASDTWRAMGEGRL